MFRISTGSAVSNTALMICNASFLAPWGMISPLSRLPPFTSKYMGLFKALFEFLRTAIVIITALIAVVAASTTTAWALLEITLVALYKAVVFTLTLSEYFYSRCVGELQLTTGDIVQLSTDLVIMRTFFMPGAVG